MHVMDRFGLSERKTCRLVELNRSSKQYKPSKRDDSEIRARIRELAEKHKKYGSPMIHAILRREGYMLNHKRTERIYREERLSFQEEGQEKAARSCSSAKGESHSGKRGMVHGFCVRLFG